MNKAIRVSLGLEEYKKYDRYCENSSEYRTLKQVEDFYQVHWYLKIQNKRQ